MCFFIAKEVRTKVDEVYYNYRKKGKCLLFNNLKKHHIEGDTGQDLQQYTLLTIS